MALHPGDVIDTMCYENKEEENSQTMNEYKDSRTILGRAKKD